METPIKARNSKSKIPICVAVLGLVGFLMACTLPLPPLPFSPSPFPSSPSPPLSPSPIPPLLISPSPSLSPSPSDLYLTADDILLYPGPGLYSGDIVTFDITPRNLGEISPYALTVHVYHQTDEGQALVAVGSGEYPAFDRVPRSRLTWSWNTTGLVGEETLVIQLDPENTIQIGDHDPTNNAVTLTVQLFPEDQRSPVELEADWQVVETDCCILHYLTGTAAERDLTTLIAMAEAGTDYAQRRLDVVMSEPLEVYLISRVIGHGGYARQWLTVSYLDRHYVYDNLEMVFRHETVHVLDRAMLSEHAPIIMREGLAVWASGGHFRPEPIPEKTAALVQLGRYIPLEQLAEDFYRQQHEAGYLQGAALVSFLIETYGWEAFQRFYTSFDPALSSPAEALDAALANTWGRGLSEIEESFLQWLEAHPPTPAQVQDMELTLYLFDTVRRYQKTYDPSAYFLSGWLPNPAEAQSRDIVADFLRHANAPENIALETMLIAAQEALEVQQFDRVQELLKAIDRVIQTGFFGDPLAADYLEIVQMAAENGYQVQRIELDETSARIWAISEWPALTLLTLQRGGEGWALVD